MLPRLVVGLAALSGALQAQGLSGVLWPPRDVGVSESFGLYGPRQNGHLLAVGCERPTENNFVRTYVREGLNWIEDSRLTIAPRTPRLRELSSFGHALDVDGDEVVVGGAGVHLFRRLREHQWSHREIPAPADAGLVWGSSVRLSGDWMAVESAGAVHLLHRDAGAWTPMQKVATDGVLAMDLEGEDLVLGTRAGIQVLRCTNEVWGQELELRAPAFGVLGSPELDGERLGLVRENRFVPFRRAGSAWLEEPVTILPAVLAASMAGGRAVVQTTADFRVLEPGVNGWVQVGDPIVPDPSLARIGRPRGTLSAASAQFVAGIGGNPVEHIEGALATFALDPSQGMTLRASQTKMQLVGGETLTFTLDAGIANAGRIFAFSGSITGSSPGTRVAGVRLPLNRQDDPYAVRSRRLGRLDGLGRATLALRIPVTMPGERLAFLKDRTLHHAFLVWQRGRGVTHISNVALTGLVGRFH